MPLHHPYALGRLGNAELALGRHAQAKAAFERACAGASDIDDGQRFDAGAGLARTALAEGDLGQAMAAVDALLAHLARAHSFEGAEQSRQILLTCYRVLQRVGDPRAAEVLGLAHAELQAKAAMIGPGSRTPDLGIRRDVGRDAARRPVGASSQFLYAVEELQ